MKKVCFVTSSLVGPTINGGVGTAMYYQACLLEKSGYNVTILFCGNYQVGNSKHWKDRFKAININYVDLNEEIVGNTMSIEKSNWWVWRSYYTLRWLKENEFDIVHFAETCGYAYHTLQAKRTLGDFSNTTIVVTMHSPTEWIYEGNRVWPYESAAKDKETNLFLKLNYAERYVCQYADCLLAPSKAMFDWAINKGWKLCDNRKVIFNPYIGDKKGQYSEIDYDHFIFFGTLDMRKGIDVFCKAALMYYKERYEGTEKQLKISFLGRNVSVEGTNSIDYIKEHFYDSDIKIEIHTDYDTYKANEYIKNSNGIAVLCSRQDNSPYSVVECIENKVPFICSRIGGIPELVSEEVLFNLNPQELKEKMDSVCNIEWTELKHFYDATSANEAIQRLNDELIQDKEVVEGKEEFSKKVTICVAYYNHGRYIEEAIENIRGLDYLDKEIIVIDDGSDENASIEAFAGLAQKYAEESDIKFLTAEHKGKGAVYNQCVREATGQFLLFYDPEKALKQNILNVMGKALEYSDSDMVTCCSQYFKGVGMPNVMNIEMKINVPLGASLENALIDFCFDNSVLLIKKSVYEKIGGMLEIDEYGVEHCLIVKAIMQQYRYEVVPEILVWCRNMGTDNKISYLANPGYGSYAMLLDTYFGKQEYMKHFMINWCLPRFEHLDYEKVDNIEKNIAKGKDIKEHYTVENRVLSGQNKELLDKLAAVRAELLVSKKEVVELKQNNGDLSFQVENLKTAVNNYENATFWKITKPFRVVIQSIRSLRK